MEQNTSYTLKSSNVNHISHSVHQPHSQQEHIESTLPAQHNPVPLAMQESRKNQCNFIIFSCFPQSSIALPTKAVLRLIYIQKNSSVFLIPLWNTIYHIPGGDSYITTHVQIHCSCVQAGRIASGLSSSTSHDCIGHLAPLSCLCIASHDKEELATFAVI